MKMREGWYKQIRSQEDRAELAMDFNVKQPPYERILEVLASTGEKTKSLSDWLECAGYRTKRKDDFVRGLSRNVERGGNESIAVEPFDMELAMKPLSVSGSLKITIRSQVIIDSLNREALDAERQRNRRKKLPARTPRGFQEDSARLPRGLQEDSKRTSESEDSSGLAGNCHADRKEKNKNIPPKGGDILCADARGVEAPPLSAEEEDPFKNL